MNQEATTGFVLLFAACITFGVIWFFIRKADEVDAAFRIAETGPSRSVSYKKRIDEAALCQIISSNDAYNLKKSCDQSIAEVILGLNTLENFSAVLWDLCLEYSGFGDSEDASICKAQINFGFQEKNPLACLTLLHFSGQEPGILVNLDNKEEYFYLAHELPTLLISLEQFLIKKIGQLHGHGVE
jgi:hypothetical protein